MGSTFGAPVPVGQQSGTGSDDPAIKVNGQAPAGAVQDIVDETDPRLTSENLDLNLEGDAYASPTPPPDGKYRVKLKNEGFKVDGGEKRDYGSDKDKNNVPYWKTSISCTIIDPSGKYDGLVVYPSFGGGASTQVRRDKTTQVSTILSKIMKPDGKSWAAGFKGTAIEWIQRFVQALATEPEIGIETQWEASCMECGKELKLKGDYATRTVGMHHFPPETDPVKLRQGLKYQHEKKCETKPGHGYMKARAQVARFLPLSELK
jgi:hypothetical protein